MTRNPDPASARQLLGERRKALRFPSDLHAHCHTGGGKTAVQWPALVRNVSKVGAGLVLARPFSAGTQFTVRFLRDGSPRFSMVKVTHSHAEGNGYYHGCAFFLPLTDEEIEILTMEPQGHQAQSLEPPSVPGLFLGPDQVLGPL